MDIRIELGWWIIPAIVTVIAFVAAWWPLRKEKPSGRGSGAGDAILGLMGLALYFFAGIVSLAAWLIWSLVP